ncbi:hypothetical protein [Kitasatospora sp. NPDC097643]|uniref:hypothetical protein n=1 Tax=Kitasatospora sp. NPDC097643 TaxID=3157230 RepID=UPI00332ACF68
MFDVRWDAESLECAGAGAIWGGVWVETEGEAFPERGWHDLPVAFVAELLDAFAEVGAGPGRRRRVRFFDGPFWVDLAGVDGGGVAVTAGSRTAEAAAPALTGAADALLLACQGRGWGEHSDVRRLRAIRSRFPG